MNAALSLLAHTGDRSKADEEVARLQGVSDALDLGFDLASFVDEAAAEMHAQEAQYLLMAAFVKWGQEWAALEAQMLEIWEE